MRRLERRQRAGAHQCPGPGVPDGIADAAGSGERDAPLTAGTPLTFPTPAGFGGSWTVQAAGSNVPDGTTVTVTLTNTAPAGVTALANTIVYVGLKTNNTTSAGGGSVFTTTIPRYFVPANTLLAFQGYNAGAWGLFAGTASLPSDNSTTLPAFTVPNAFTLTGNTQYWFALTVGASSSTTVS